VKPAAARKLVALLFTNGRDQAAHLPVVCRFDTKKV
jgi:virulence-associated protein VagC